MNLELSLVCSSSLASSTALKVPSCPSVWVIPIVDCSRSPLSMTSITPDIRMTGIKNIALASERPLNFWFSRFAAKKLNIMISGTFANM